MPIENIEHRQKQGRLFLDKLSKELNPKHKLYKLKELINWSDLEEQVGKIVNVRELGRERKSLRVMLGLSMLQAMFIFLIAWHQRHLRKMYTGSIFVDMSM